MSIALALVFAAVVCLIPDREDAVNALLALASAGSPALTGSPRSLELGNLDLLPGMASLDSGSSGLPLQLSATEMDD